MTRAGLIELLGRVQGDSIKLHPLHFYFIEYFIGNYRRKILSTIEQEGAQFPLALKLEVELLLQADRIIETQIQLVELELIKIGQRIEAAQKSSALAREKYSAGQNTEEVAREIEKRYPYELNSQKPLTELLAEVPDDTARWELTEGALRRLEQLWFPTKQLLESYLETLRALALKQ